MSNAKNIFHYAVGINVMQHIDDVIMKQPKETLSAIFSALSLVPKRNRTSGTNYLLARIREKVPQQELSAMIQQLITSGKESDLYKVAFQNASTLNNSFNKPVEAFAKTVEKIYPSPIPKESPPPIPLDVQSPLPKDLSTPAPQVQLDNTSNSVENKLQSSPPIQSEQQSLDNLKPLTEVSKVEQVYDIKEAPQPQLNPATPAVYNVDTPVPQITTPSELSEMIDSVPVNYSQASASKRNEDVGIGIRNVFNSIANAEQIGAFLTANSVPLVAGGLLAASIATPLLGYGAYKAYNYFTEDNSESKK